MAQHCITDQQVVVKGNEGQIAIGHKHKERQNFIFQTLHYLCKCYIEKDVLLKY